MLSTLRRSTGIGAATATALLFRRAASSSAAAAAAEAAAKKTGKKKEEAPGIIGIDLGTTNSCCAVWERGEARVLENAEGARTTPSVVAFAPSAAAQQPQQLASVVVGAAARRQGVTNAANTIFATKRLVGRRFEDPTVQHMRSAVPYKIVRGPNGDAWVETTDGRQHSASEIGAHVLARMKETADRHMGVGANASKRAVITCPAYFNDAQRQATKDAGRIAGLDVLRIINEPTAAALAYGLRSSDNGKVVAVFDLGGGTFDISVLEIAGGVFEVKATNGDTFLGGEDFDNALVAHLAAEFRAAHPKSAAAARLVALLQQGSTSDDRDARLALQRLREAAERAKCELSSAPVAEVNLPFLAVDAAAGGAPLHLQTKITRAQFEALTEPLVRRTISPVRQCLADAKMRPSDVSEVVLVGGMTRMPRVIDEVRKVFGKEPFRGVNPDEAVAIGAAVQGGVLEGSVKSVVLLDVTPLSLGIETLGGVFTKLIDRNTTIPAKRSQVFSTADDFQSEVEVKVFQGERSMARDNKLLGSFFLTGIPPLPRGQAQIDVSFDIDTNGIVHVRARDRRSGKEQSIRIEPAGGLSELEIQKIVSQAEALKEKDAQDRALAEARNAAETVVRAAQEALREHGKKVALAAASNVTREIEAVKKAAAASDPDAITRASANLREVTMQTFASAFAEQQQQQQQPTAPAPTSAAADASSSSSSSQQEKK